MSHGFARSVNSLRILTRLALVIATWTQMVVVKCPSDHQSLLFAQESAGAEPDESLSERLLDRVKMTPDSTPLHLAVVERDDEKIEELLEAGADPKARNSMGFSPFAIATLLCRDSQLIAQLMRTKDNLEQAVPISKADFGSRPRGRELNTPASLVQWNPTFGYRLVVPPDWKLVGLQQDGVFQRQSQLVVTMPAVWSELESQDIENAVSFYAMISSEPLSLKQAAKDFESRRLPQGATKRQVDHQSVTFDYQQRQGRLTYQCRSIVRVEDQFVYHITFIATPGTFEKNLLLYSAYVDSIELTKEKIEGETSE